ncbi:AI-2E family transporter [Sphaerisporangium melleum]|uniref:AI-2E family transporter n=1 Tax=Sphaerisporangium melleum TaxID=321316 RepID=A0A917RMU6_9ACTN|nr:AI-2E family transporter [Sphaerisporangium melleum]GGL15245.1 AI-2E family transporter [Sphaerisporangium melleum]GII74533.1 AI-2E family transporter [Sphaerisporangium melleum]
MSERTAPRALVLLLVTASAVVVLAGIKAISTIVGPIVLALVLVVAVSPIREWLVRRQAPAWTAVAVPFSVVMVALLGMMAILSTAVAQLAVLLPSYSAQFNKLVADTQRWAAQHGIAPQVNEALRSVDAGKVVELAQGLAASVLGVVSSLFLIVVLLLAMSLDAPVVSRIMAAAAPERPAITTALATFASRTRRYLLVSTIFGLICAALDVLALYLLSVPLPLLWGVLALITNYIPNIGFVVGLVPPALLALLTGGLPRMILVIVAYLAINIVVQSFIQPKFLGDAVGLSTTVTFLSLILWATVLGPLGALLAIPLTLLARALLIDSDPGVRWSAAFVSGELPPDRADATGSSPSRGSV